METLLGIDFGKTHTKISAHHNGQIVMVPLLESKGIISSFFCIDSESNLLFGGNALKYTKLKDPGQKVSSVFSIFLKNDNGKPPEHFGLSSNEMLNQYFRALK